MRISAEIRLRHAIVVQARKARGWSQQQLADAVGTEPKFVSAVEQMQFRRSVVRDVAIRIAAVLGLPTDEVLPPDMEEDIIARITAVKDVDTKALLQYTANQQSRMILPAPDETTTGGAVLEEQLEKLLAAALTEREREIVKLRFGMSGGRIHTLDEIASRYQLSKQAVQDVEKHAIRKLQRPYRITSLKEFATDREYDRLFTPSKQQIDGGMQDSAQ
jgi:RNA polymerase primary sigma factor